MGDPVGYGDAVGCTRSPLRISRSPLRPYLHIQVQQHPTLGPVGLNGWKFAELDALKHLVARYIGFVWALLKPLGSWAVFAIAAVDSAFFGVPLDPVVATYVYQNRSHALLYPLLAAAGSAAGCILLYWIGYRGGEVLLLKRMPRAKFERIRATFDRHEFWALVVPSMMPPPFPFKVFALAASVFEMNFWHFLLAIFVGRLIRFLILGLLELFAQHWVVLILAFTGATALGVYGWARSRKRSALQRRLQNK
jgi:membrane protein YqaA with SNARE-associated domain